MGIIRKALSGTAAAITGGASLTVLQFRSDTERNTRQIKKLRRSTNSPALQAQPSEVHPLSSPGYVGDFSNKTVVFETTPKDEALKSRPGDLSPGWKPHPTSSGSEQFWNGTKWTTMVREVPEQNNE